MSGLDECFVIERQCRFEPDDPERCGCHWVGFFVRMVGGVVGCEDSDDAVGDPFAECFHVPGFAQWRVHLGSGAQCFDRFMGEQQVMGGCFGGDGLSCFLSSLDEFDGLAAGHVLDVVSAVDTFVEHDVALDDELFGDARPALVPEAGGDLAGVHGGVFGEGEFLAVLHERFAGLSDCLEDGPHHRGGFDDISIVAKTDGSGLITEGDLGELLPLASLGRGGDAEDSAASYPIRFGCDVLDNLGRIEAWDGIGHAADSGESAGGCGFGSRFDVFFVGLPRIAEVDMRVDEPWGEDFAGGIDDTISGFVGDAGLDGLDDALGDEHIADLVEPGCGIDDTGVLDQ